jgi:ATP-dependent Clp protease protease subunit
MEKLIKLLKGLTKASIVTSILIGGAITLLAYVKYPFESTLGPLQQETKIVEKEVPAKETATNTATAKIKELLYTPANGTPANDVKILPVKPSPAKTEKQQTIILGKKNTLVLKGVVNMLSVSKLQQEAILMSAKLDKNTPIYLVLDTPGGSVTAGQILVDTLKALPNKVHTITLFSASMGYHIVQRLDDRLILPSGTLMSHRMRVGGIEGQVPGEAVTAMNDTIRLANKLDREVSERINMPFEEYRAAIRDELWLDGSDSVAQNMADKEILALCGQDMMGTYEEKIDLLFFVIKATWSECPLIRFPVKVEMADLTRSRQIFGIQAAAKQAEYEKFINTLMYDKAKFVHEYIVTDKYKEFISQ